MEVKATALEHKVSLLLQEPRCCPEMWMWGTDLRVTLHTHLRMGHSREGKVTLRTEFSD